MGRWDKGKFERLSVRDFQSITKMDVVLGDFTVVVGSSNSGKSALLRALKAVVRNVNSPAAVRVGAKHFVSRVAFGGNEVVIERGKSSSTYRTIRGQQEEMFAKSGRSVPAEVQALLGLPEPEGPDLIFSSQIDPPFLLAETGSTVAKVFGDLTNVSRLHAAAREANRRRSESEKLRKIRVEDAKECATRLQTEFAGLRDEAERVKTAKAELGAIRDRAKELETLRSKMDDLTMVEAALESARETIAGLPEPSDVLGELEEITGLVTTLRQIQKLTFDLSAIDEQWRTAEMQIGLYVAQGQELDEEFHEILKDAGTCPVCGKDLAA